MPSNNEYYRKYRQGERALKKGDRENLTEQKFNIKFNGKKLKASSFKNFYKDKIENTEQELIFNNCISLIDLINSDKECLEKMGTYISNVTGTLKVNPAQKELRENLKAFNTQLALLQSLLVKEEKEEDLEEWLND